MVQVADVQGLTGSLVEMAADPERTGKLYQLLGGYCHQCRNRLHSLKFSLYMANQPRLSQQDEVWTELERRYCEVEQFVEQLQTICRPMSLNLMQCSLGAVLQERQDAWAERLGRYGRTLELISSSKEPAGCFDPWRIAQGLDGLIGWRAPLGTAGSQVRIESGCDDDQLVLNWDEPGNARLDTATCTPERPISLALPMMTRVVAAHGGSLVIALHKHLRFCLRWPREAAPTP